MKRCALVSREDAKGFGFTAEAQRTRRGLVSLSPICHLLSAFRSRRLPAAGYRNSLNPISYLLSSSRRGLAAAAVMALALSAAPSVQAQTTLTQGDVALLAINSANPDSFRVVLLKDVVANTVINFTDNGFTAGTTGRTGEGFLTYTVPAGGHVAGSILTWSNGMTITGTGWSSSAPSNFAFNGSGDQLFVFQGNTANWASQSGITLIHGINYGTAISSTSAAANTVQPTALTSAWISLPASTNANGYYSGSTSSTSSVSISGTVAQILANLVDTTKWFGNSGSAATFPSYTISITPTITIGGNTSATATAFTTTYGTASSSQSFAVAGANLTADITVEAVTGFEYSIDGGSNWSTTRTISRSGSSASATLLVRLAATATASGSFNSQSINLSSTGATTRAISTAASGNSVSKKALTITAGNQTVSYGTAVATVTGAAAIQRLVLSTETPHP